MSRKTVTPKSGDSQPHSLRIYAEKSDTFEYTLSFQSSELRFYCQKSLSTRLFRKKLHKTEVNVGMGPFGDTIMDDVGHHMRNFSARSDVLSNWISRKHAILYVYEAKT